MLVKSEERAQWRKPLQIFVVNSLGEPLAKFRFLIKLRQYEMIERPFLFQQVVDRCEVGGLNFSNLWFHKN